MAKEEKQENKSMLVYRVRAKQIKDGKYVPDYDIEGGIFAKVGKYGEFLSGYIKINKDVKAGTRIPINLVKRN